MRSKLEAKLLEQRYGRPGTVRETAFRWFFLTLPRRPILLRSRIHPASRNPIDGLAKFLEHCRSQVQLEKRRDAIEVFGRGAAFNLDLLSESTVRIGKIVYVNGASDDLSVSASKTSRAALKNSTARNITSGEQALALRCGKMRIIMILLYTKTSPSQRKAGRASRLRMIRAQDFCCSP